MLKYRPDIHDLFTAWQSVGFRLERGQWVMTIRPGFSGLAGVVCQYLGAANNGFGKFGFLEDDGEVKWLLRPAEFVEWIVPIDK